jgi:general secretion pathway protein K
MRQQWPRRLQRGHPSAGFALLIVLWTLVLIAFLVLHMTASGHTEMRIAGNLQSNAVAAAAADGGISAAIFSLTSPQPEERWPAAGPPHLITIGNCRVEVQIENEAARINPNLASPVLMEALLRAAGLDPNNAQQIAEAIADWVGASPTQKTADTLKAEYQAAGLDYAPPTAPFESLDEIGRVLGMTPALYAALRPHLTLFGPAQPDPVGADPVVAAALAQIPQTAEATTPVATAPADSQTLRIISEAMGPGNGRASRTAVVRVTAGLPQGYAVLAWRNTVD